MPLKVLTVKPNKENGRVTRPRADSNSSTTSTTSDFDEYIQVMIDSPGKKVQYITAVLHSGDK
jgi:hypothetical protein